MEYTYKCKRCGEFEVEHSMTEESLKECPKCGQTISRVFRPSTAVWKCDGAYGKTKNDV